MRDYHYGPSLSTAVSRDLDARTVASQKPSTAPTSTLPPQSSVNQVTKAPSVVRQPLAGSNTLPVLPNSNPRHARALPRSATWTSFSGDMDILSDTDQIQDRRAFVEEYNRLAKKLGIRVLQEFPETRAGTPIDKPEKRRWWSRIFRSPSSGPSAKARGPSGSLRHKRSVSDMALHLVHAWKPDPKTLDLQTMVRLSGKSFFYLPPEYSVEALVIPTCFRATAQHLVQYGPDTRGIFRIPGSLRIINAIFDYYCHETAGEEINSTTRCPSLPAHLNAATHDVASVFKKFISVLPGGILGSLAVYDALVAVYAQYRREPELSRTKETKARARLIALAIETVESKFRRELVCAVFGLLSVIGRAAETAARKDELGRPLPTSDLMGYTALGIIFGPLIVGDLLGSYDMKLDNPSPGPVLLPVTPPTLKLERQRNDNLEDAGLQAVNKAHVANDVTEMLITNWREIVRNIRSFSSLGTTEEAGDGVRRRNLLRSSASEPFIVGLPNGWKSKRNSPGKRVSREVSPTPDASLPAFRGFASSKTAGSLNNKLKVTKNRSNMSRSVSSNLLSMRQSLDPLPPTTEESPIVGHNNKDLSLQLPIRDANMRVKLSSITDDNCSTTTPLRCPGPATIGREDEGSQPKTPSANLSASTPRLRKGRSSIGNVGSARHRRGHYSTESPHVSEDLVPERTSSKSTSTLLVQPMTTANKQTHKENSSSRKKAGSEMHSKQHGGERTNHDSGTIYPATRRVVTDRSRTSPSGSPAPRATKSKGLASFAESTRTAGKADGGLPAEPGAPAGPAAPGARERENVARPNMLGISKPTNKVSKDIPTQEDSPLQGQTSPKAMNTAQSYSPTRTPRQDVTDDGEWKGNNSIQSTTKELSQETGRLPNAKSGRHEKVEPKSQTSGYAMTASYTPSNIQEVGLSTRKSSRNSLVAAQAAEVAQRSRSSAARLLVTPSRRSGGTAGTSTPSRGSSSKPGGVKAMAAMFEVAAKDSSHVSSPATARQSQTSEAFRGLARSRLDTPSPRSLRPTLSSRSLENVVPEKTSNPASNTDQEMTSQPDSISDSHTSQVTYHRATKYAPEDSRQGTHSIGQPAYMHNLQKHVKTPQTISSRDMDENLPSLGTMTKPAEQPPIARHITFSRPPSTTSLRQFTEDAVLQRTASPGGNSVLHIQIRNLQKQLDARNEEAASLKRQLDLREKLDVGTLSEQLRAAKRENSMWKDRAEAAEKRVAVLERFTKRLRDIKGGDAQVDIEPPPSRHQCSMGSDMAESKRLCASETKKTLRNMDGTRSSDGGAAAWWIESRSHTPVEPPIRHSRADLTDESILAVVKAVQELLADEAIG